MMCRGTLLAQPFQHKFGSRERGHAWDEVADQLSKISEPKLFVNQSPVRARYSKLDKGFKRKIAMEERASGISPQMTEVDEATEEELAKAEGERRAMERLGETKERENGERVRKDERILE